MIVAYSLFLLLGIAAYFLLGKLETPVRVLLALAIVLIDATQRIPGASRWVCATYSKYPPG